MSESSKEDFIGTHHGAGLSEQAANDPTDRLVAFSRPAHVCPCVGLCMQRRVGRTDILHLGVMGTDAGLFTGRDGH